MDMSFNDASWIWHTENETPDTYGDFIDKFNYAGDKTTIHISCDGDYTLFVNGNFVASNQYGDFEHYKIYDSIDITDNLTIGENTILLTVWHFGISSLRYKKAKAGLLYEVESGGRMLCKSDEKTLSRQNPNYKSNYQKNITFQLGQSFLYDATKSCDEPFHNSVIVNKNCVMHPRPIRKSLLLKEKDITILKNEGNHYLIDLGEETVGLPVLDFFTETIQKITVCWGEHIVDGGVRRKIDDRDFSFEYIAQKGENKYTNYMLRLGCRYIEVFCENPIKLNYIGIIPQIYPVKLVEKKLGEPKKQEIYDLCVKTLKLCLMEHYVDTPWREQGLYVYDSRNQMLCGYRAFEDGNSEYARANLLLISKDNREDGILSMTYPSGISLAIPSFSLHYFTSVKEYIENTNDLSLACDVYDKLLSIIEVFRKQICGGLLYSFTGNGYWNFYDWSSSMTEEPGTSTAKADLMINSLFVLALENFKIISQKINKPFLYQYLIDELKVNIKKNFFEAQEGLFSMSINAKVFTELGNSVAILAGLTTEEESKLIAEKLISNSLEECSLSLKCFKYDALLMVDKKYYENIIKEICDTYEIMLNNGATSVWEVIDGESAFGNAGSLCHGWSATPILYL